MSPTLRHPHLLLIFSVLYQSPASHQDVQLGKEMFTFQDMEGDVPEVTALTPVPIPSNFVIYKTLKKCAASCTAENPLEGLQARRRYNFCVMVNLGRYVCCNHTIRICDTYSDNEEEFRFRLEGILPIGQPDPCNPNPCRHGGTCSKRGGQEEDEDYKCQCPVGFSGSRCHLSHPVMVQKGKTVCREGAVAGGHPTCYHGECVQKKTGSVFEIIPRVAPWNRMVITEARKRMYENAGAGELYQFKNSEVCLCYPGYRGVDCKRDCKPGTWGFYCLLRCDPHCRDGRCNHETGECDCSDGYMVDEETSSCLPDGRPGQCKKLCESLGRGECSGEYCSCNEEGKGGFYCENSCSNFTRPRYGRKCGLPCGACTIQPCDPVSGECPKPRNNEPRCLRIFTGEQCIRYLDGVLSAELEVQYQLYWEAYDDDWKFERDMEQLLNSVDSVETLVEDLNLGFYSNVDSAITVKNTEVKVVGTKERRSVKQRSAPRLLQNDDSKLGMNFVASAPALYYNASKLKQAVNEGLLTMSRTFRTALAPGLRIDKNSIKVSKARMVRNSSQKVEDDTEGVSTILFGVLLGLVALIVICITSFCLMTKVTKIAKLRKLNIK